jgi:hypothetical protein
LSGVRAILMMRLPTYAAKGWDLGTWSRYCILLCCWRCSTYSLAI